MTDDNTSCLECDYNSPESNSLSVFSDLENNPTRADSDEGVIYYYTYVSIYTWILPSGDDDLGEKYLNFTINFTLTNKTPRRANGVTLSLGFDGYWYQKNFHTFYLDPKESETIEYPDIDDLLASRNYTTYNEIYCEHTINNNYQIDGESSWTKTTFTLLPNDLLLKNAQVATATELSSVAGNGLSSIEQYGDATVVKDDIGLSNLTIGAKGDGNFALMNCGSLTNSTVTTGGRVEITETSRGADGLTVSGGIVVSNPTQTSYVRNTSISNDGGVFLIGYSSGSNITVDSDGFLYLNGQGTLWDSTVNDGGVLVATMGLFSHLTLNDGAQAVITKGYVYAPLNHDSLALDINQGANCTISSGAMASNVNVAGHLSIGSQLTSLGSGNEEFDNLNLILEAEFLKPDNTVALVDGFRYLDPSVTNVSISVTSNMEDGEYLLATGIGDYRPTSIALVVDGETPVETYEGQYTFEYTGISYLDLNGTKNGLDWEMVGEWGPEINYNGEEYILSAENDNLVLKIGEQETTTRYFVEISTDNFQHAIRHTESATSLHLLGLPEGEYQWRIRKTESDSWTCGEDIASDNNADTPQVLLSTQDSTPEIFFAQGSGTWGVRYMAQHTGSLNDWDGTNETISVYRKNRFRDLFVGSDNANILYLTDDDNGDALFVDDIYTGLPGTGKEQQARIANIDEIRAGAGDDVVDMTSQQFEYLGDDLTIRGGAGNDVLWANKGNNMLFGDAGKDRLVGASGNDVIVGGSGNDSMHGGGGEDLFCFCKDWGEDSVKQIADGRVTLWFAEGSQENWDKESLTYSDGTNKVKVTGVTADKVTLKFGDDASEQFKLLTDLGAFLDVSSEKIYEDEGTGILASL